MKLNAEKAAYMIGEEQPQVIILIKDTEDVFKVTIFGRTPKPEAAELIDEFSKRWQERIKKTDNLPF